MPLPHLVALPMLHVYKTGLLIDAAESRTAVHTLWNHLREAGWHGLKFPLFPIGSPLSLLLNAECERRQLGMVTHNQFERAIVSRHQASCHSGISSARLKSLQRGSRALERCGEVNLRFNDATLDGGAAIERFLSLESLGWKGLAGVSLLSNADEAEAFRQIAREFQHQRRICFAELSAGTDLIASMCLFRSESDYYAFKIGWNPEYERGCPGFLLGHLIRRHIGELAGCERLDGCGRQGIFLDHVWDARKIIADAVFPTTRWGSLAAQGSSWGRLALRRLCTLAEIPHCPST